MRKDYLQVTWKEAFLGWMLLLTMGLLWVSVTRLSLIKGRMYQTLARENKVEETKIPAARGKIIDRKGRLLTESVYRYFKYVDGQKVYQGSGEFEGYKFEGKDLAYDLKRKYSYTASMGLLTGYVGLANETELKNGKCGRGIVKSDVIGRGGVEDEMDCDLRGVDGKRLVEVDARGKYVRELGRAEPQPGKDLVLSIDAFWQEKIYQLLDGRKAVVIISEPDTGKIIAMVSSPGFDANAFSFNQDNVAIKSYLENKDGLPLLNRAIAAKYHPGSVFKMTVATAGLESGVIDKNTLIEDTGVIKVGDYSYNNWLWTKRGATDGMVDVVKALKKSNDIYFYRLGEKLGVDRIKDWADKFGYGSKTGVEMPGEVAGVVPDDKWKREVKGERWFLGDTYHLAIGQGFLDTTPIQVNLATNVIANNGWKCQMSLLKDKLSNCQRLPASAETLRTVKQGMLEACSSGGTAWPLFNFKTEIACKTGTAEVGDGSKDTHAWLTAFAPADNPEISITVFVERGGEGSDVAGPIMGDILKEWFNEPETLVPRYKEQP